MPSDDRRSWTDADFGEMSWHDNHVHGLQVRAGQYGSGELSLDIDYIVEWLCSTEGSCQFRIAPATLTFRDVTDLRVEIDYAAATAALTPFSIGQVRRERIAQPGQSIRYRWVIEVNWPHGSISFQAAGFTQALRERALVKSEQWLEPAERLPPDS
jgi:hypothetical protein